MKSIFFLLIFLSCTLKGEIPLESKIYVAGHNGLVGRAIIKKLKDKGYENIVVRTSKELDLCSQEKTMAFFEEERPDYVFIAAAKVGGILANYKNKADFIYNNLMISSNIIHSAAITHAKKVLVLGSTCIYPRDCPQPIREDYLMTGPLETTNDAYAVAKIASIHLAQNYHKKFDTNYICLMPTNLYGPFDNFDLKTSHVLPALIRKFIEAKENHLPNVKLWGSGKPLREFLHVEDLAEASLFLMNHYDEPDIINVGCGKDISIFDLAMLIKERVGYEGEILFDASKPDGTPRKVTSIEKIENLGWSPTISLTEGIDSTIDWFLTNRDFIK
ncbi:MAG: GDP-L-fucose synthase [Simkaniaceae bacterium]